VDGAVISQAAFPVLGASAGWETALNDSELSRRSEPIMLLPGAKSLRVTMDSGTSATTGVLLIDNFDIIDHQPGHSPTSFWVDQSLLLGENMESPTGTPAYWQRRGTDSTIARVHSRGLGNRALCLVDGSQRSGAAWIATRELPRTITTDTIVMVEWMEAHNVIGGNVRRASYLNVPSGSYGFRAIATTADGASSAKLMVPIRIKAHFWTQPWYWGLVGTLAAALVGFGILTFYRRRNRLRLRALRLQNALAEDRARIARDMHDDLGTRMSVLTMSSSVAERLIETDPTRCRSHLARMNVAAREIVAAMDDLVWSVNPANDKLGSFGAFLARTAKEVFTDSQVHWRLDLPSGLPDVTLHSDLRHHLALSIKECCHNILRHAGPCEANLKLGFDDGNLTVEITDNGRGFDVAAPRDRNGLANIKRRMHEVGGGFEITSIPGHGTSVTITCRA
jgi:signal transduction histidine kinase